MVDIKNFILIKLIINKFTFPGCKAKDQFLPKALDTNSQVSKGATQAMPILMKWQNEWHQTGENTILFRVSYI